MMDAKKVDVLNVIDSAVKIMDYFKLGTDELMEARSAVTELISASSDFLSEAQVAQGYGAGVGGPTQDRLEVILSRIGAPA